MHGGMMWWWAGGEGGQGSSYVEFLRSAWRTSYAAATQPAVIIGGVKRVHLYM